MITPQEALERILKSFKRYYNINTENPEPPFDAQAEFHSHAEQYFLVKAAKLSEQNSNEYVYFSTGSSLSSGALETLSNMSWASGLKNVKPNNGHRESDVSLILFYDHIDEDAKKLIRRTRLSKVYFLTIYGWSNFRLAAAELSTGKFYSNWHGRDTKKTLRKVLSGKR